MAAMRMNTGELLKKTGQRDDKIRFCPVVAYFASADVSQSHNLSSPMVNIFTATTYSGET